MPRNGNSKSKVETSKTILTTVRMPKNLNTIIDVLVDSGVFQTKTEVINLALRRFLSEVFFAIITLEKLNMSEYLSDPERFKELFKDPAFIEGSSILENAAFQIYFYYITNIPQRVPPTKFPTLMEVVTEQMMDVVGQSFFEKFMQIKTENAEKENVEDVISPHASEANPPRDNSPGGDSS